MLPYQVIAGGSFTSDSNLRFDVELSDQPDLFWLRNRTAWGDDAAETSVESWWRQGMANGAAQTVDQANATGIMSTEAVTTGGFTFIDTTNPPVFTALAGTVISQANGAVITMANTGSIQQGDVVRVYGSTGMLQIAGYDFTVGTVNANTNIELDYLDSSGFAAAATAAEVQLIIQNRIYPRWRYITKITQAAQAVVTFSVAHDYTVGERISFRVPSQFGMDEMNNQNGIVQSITASTVTVDINSSGYTAFAFPTSAVAAAGISPAVAVPSGAGPTPGANPPGVSVNAAIDNRNKYLMRCGSNVITSSSAVYDWVAYKFDNYTAQ